MKNVGIIRRTPEDDVFKYLVKLDASAVDNQGGRQIFSVIDRQFRILGTARVKEKKHGQATFELLFNDLANANAMQACTGNEAISKTWGRINTRLNGELCIEVDIMSQVSDPEMHGFHQYHPHGHNAQMKRHARA